MKGRFQWKATVEINSSSKRLWEIIDDISLIPQYHPEVQKVDYLSGQTKRAIGVKYRCNKTKGRKGTCVEEVVEHIAGQKMSTGMVEDSWGMSTMLANFRVDTTVIPQGDNSSILQFEAYYDPINLKTSLLNVLILRGIMRKRAIRTREGIKRLSEQQ